MSETEGRARHISTGKYPKIYAYTVPATVDKGHIKVGYTTQKDAEKRIREQLINLPAGEQHFTLLGVWTAITDNNDIFTDKAVHKELRDNLGCTQLRNQKGSLTEWFKCTLEEVEAAVVAVQAHRPASRGQKVTFGMRPEQQRAVDMTADYFRCNPRSKNTPAPHFLWNAKMRFGKTFTTYQLAKEMGWKRVLVLTYKPAVQNSWREDLLSHADFDGWQFIGKGEEWGSQIDEDRPVVWFASFQDVTQRDKTTKGIKERLEMMFAEDWDCVVLDEYHFGAWRDGAKELYDSDRSESSKEARKASGESNPDEAFNEDATPLSANHFLYLSGTPFRAISDGEFMEDEIFNWTYGDEQEAKADWATVNPGDDYGNPYRELPKLVMLTYKMPDELRKVAQDGEFNEFDLNEFFSATVDEGTGGAKFKHGTDVQKWLQLLQGRWLGTHAGQAASASHAELPFADLRLKSALRHTLWFLPNVAACHALGDLLKRDDFFSEYEVVVSAGEKAGIGVEALPPVERAMGDQPTETRSITLSCGKLTTGVTVKPWSGVFMLRDTNSPEAYFQTAFRGQSPWAVNVVDGENGARRELLKDTCYVLDFAPQRAFEKINDYANRLQGANDSRTPEERIDDLLGFLPVLAYDGHTMQEVDCGTLLDVVATGVGSTMLARKWTSTLLVNVNAKTLEKLLANEELVKALQNMESFSNLNIKDSAEKSLNTEKDLNKTKKEGKKQTKEQDKAEKESKGFQKQMRENLIKFAARIPVFMYLTEFREAALKDVIESLDTELFTRVTGLTKKNFQQLCEVGLFNGPMMDEAVLAFRRFEEGSLTYLDPTLAEKYSIRNVGGFTKNASEMQTEPPANDSSLPTPVSPSASGSVWAAPEPAAVVDTLPPVASRPTGDTHWDAMYKMAFDYFREHGFWPSEATADRNAVRVEAAWVRKQRRNFVDLSQGKKVGDFTKAKIAKLDATPGWLWSLVDDES